MDPVEILAELARLRTVRQDLDRAERELIEEAREQGVGWARIAESLGLATRQAAEQRLLRLSAGTSRDPSHGRVLRQEQRIVDEKFGPALAAIRKAASAAARRVTAVDGWDTRHPRAALVRIALELAVSAPPGALYELVQQAIDDSAQIPEALLPAEVAQALRKLALTLRTGPSRM